MSSNEISMYDMNVPYTFKCQLCPFYAADQDTVSQHYQLTHCEPIEAALRGVIATSTASNVVTSDANKQSVQIGMIQTQMARQTAVTASGPSTVVSAGHQPQQPHQVQHQIQQTTIQPHQTTIAGNQLVPVSLQVFQCGQCDYQTHKRGNLNAHVQQMHSEKRPFPCPHCDYRAKTERHLQAHIPTHGGDEPPFRCNQCSFETSDRSALVQHVQAVHESDKVFSCEQCTYKARTSDYLAKHKVTQHTPLSERQFQCPHCSKKFAIESLLRRHLKKHLDNTRHNCPHCGNAFKDIRRHRTRCAKAPEESLKKEPAAPKEPAPPRQRGAAKRDAAAAAAAAAASTSVPTVSTVVSTTVAASTAATTTTVATVTADGQVIIPQLLQMPNGQMQLDLSSLLQLQGGLKGVPLGSVVGLNQGSLLLGGPLVSTVRVLPMSVDGQVNTT